VIVWGSLVREARRVSVQSSLLRGSAVEKKLYMLETLADVASGRVLPASVTRRASLMGPMIRALDAVVWAAAEEARPETRISMEARYKHRRGLFIAQLLSRGDFPETGTTILSSVDDAPD
jgi:hypothetical protein